MSAISYYTHTYSENRGRAPPMSTLKGLSIAFKGTLLSQSMESCLPGWVTGDQSSKGSDSTPGRVLPAIKTKSESKASQFYQIPLWHIFQFETDSTSRRYYEPGKNKKDYTSLLGKAFQMLGNFSMSLLKWKQTSQDSRDRHVTHISAGVHWSVHWKH